MGNSSPLDEHRSRIEAMVERLLRPYIEELRRGISSPRSKEFNDPIWGTLYLRAEEVVVLDSPLIQRLRRIRQLGVVHYVYPAASHTRLEHSLGVVHQVQRMITSLNGRGFEGQNDSGRESHGVIDKPMESTLRMAALCHDIGHGFMSHVSEYALDRNRPCKDLQLQFQMQVERPSQSQLSELAAYYMVGSPAFSELITIAYESSAESPPPDLIQNIQSLILGMRIEGKALLVHELISGPFDADKLDYLARDSYLCGVPNVTDIPRLIQKLRATEVDRERLPSHLKSGTPDLQGGYVITGIATSGGRTLDEIALARALLFDKVYRHQKVRSVEYMVFAIVELLAEMVTEHPSMIPFMISDDEILELSPERIAAVLNRDLEQADEAAVQIITDLSTRLRDRRLFARGFAFASVMTDDDFRSDAAQSAGLRKFLNSTGESSGASEFMGVVHGLLIDIVAHLGEDLPVPEDALKWYVQLSPPRPAPRGRSDTSHAQLIESDGTITPFSIDAAETTPWSDAYVATRDLGHIFCPEELAPYVFIAAQAALLQVFGVRVPPSMLNYAKQSSGIIESLRRRLADAGWYDDRPGELRAEPEVLRDAAAMDRISNVVDRFQGYWGPARAGSAGESLGPSGTVNNTQVREFVRQFAQGGDGLVSSALTILSNVRILGRSDIGKAISDFIVSEPDYRGASCAALGSAKDSSTVLTYFIGDIARDFDLVTRTLEEAVARDEPIIFVDDFVGTGRQTVDIVQSWLGEERTEELDEERSVLAPRTQDLLKSSKLAFVFAAGTEPGRQNVVSKLEALGLDVKVFVGDSGADLPTVSSVLTGEAASEFLEFAQAKGKQLLKFHNGRERDEEWCDERALGYGNDAFLITSAFNTPTAALTLLWADGDGWKPLLPRRTKV